MYWQEIPYRALTVIRSLMQSLGWFSAAVPPAEASDAHFGRAWCRVPTPAHDAAWICSEAQRLLNGDLKVFGQSVRFHNGLPDWNSDPVTGQQIPLDFGLFIDFRHIGSGIDIKHLWELNRHVWWVRIAQAWAVSGEPAYLERIGTLIDSWIDSCPYPRGANWASPVEHGIRLINWSLVWQLIGGEGSPLFSGARGKMLRDRWLTCVFQHVRFASDNYSFYSSADNHLIGEAAGVFVASHTWDRWADVRDLRRCAKQILETETAKQLSDDGVNLEQAFCYHKFTLQFLLASGLCGRANHDDFSRAFWSRVEAAVTFLAAMIDAGGHVPAVGDSDDGEVWRLGAGEDFDGYHSIVALGAALFNRIDLGAKFHALRSGAGTDVPWLLESQITSDSPADLQQLPRHFPAGGYSLLGRSLHTEDELRVLVDCGPLGYNRVGGHAHADALAVQVSCGGEPLLVDAGTYCYNAAARLRHYFRGTHAHNTLVVDGRDQSEYGASFLWLRDVSSTIVAYETEPNQSLHVFHDGYLRLPDPVRHHRRVSVAADGGIVVEDWLDCAAPHEAELLWHGAIGTSLCCVGSSGAWHLQGVRYALSISFDGTCNQAEVIEGREDPPQGWVSPAFYCRRPAPVLALKTTLARGAVLRSYIRVARRHDVGSGAVR